jgi:tripartite-type tricarboxylate transporter receptor subunit TctC
MKNLLKLLHLLAASLMSLAVGAQPAFPARPVHIVVPYPAGGIPDVMARIVGEKMAAGLGQPVVVEPKPGASGNIAAMQVKAAAPDGHTLMLAAPFLTVNPLLDPNTRFGTADFTPVGLIAAAPNLLVVTGSLPVTSLGEFVAHAKARPGKLNTANYGTGTSNHLGTEAFLAQSGLDLTMINYKGQIQAVPDMLNGQIHFMFLSTAMAIPHLKSGQMRALAVSADRRLPALPDVPTVAEAGFADAKVLPWFGLVAPAGTPAVTVQRLNAELGKALRDPDVLKRLDGMHASSMAGTPAEFAGLLRTETARWADLIKRRNIQPEK